MGVAPKFTHVSLFSGAGGLDIGLEKAGFKTIWANDFNHDACETHKLWSDATMVEGDVGNIDFNTIPEADIISGGFPCQGFSLAGPRKIDDSRNSLYRYFVRLVELKQPKVFIAENVKGLLTMSDGSIIDAIIHDFSDKGYRVTVDLVNAADYGVSQDRVRVILVGIRNDLDVAFKFPEPNTTRMSLNDVIGCFPAPATDEVCNAPYSSRYMSRNRKRGWHAQSFTIPAMAKQVPLHPSSPDMIKLDKDLWQFGNGLTRRLSYKEAAAIQTFPNGMIFCGDLTSKYKQIGNTVPVGLGRAIGDMLIAVSNNGHKVVTKRMRGTDIHRKIQEAIRLD